MIKLNNFLRFFHDDFCFPESVLRYGLDTQILCHNLNADNKSFFVLNRDNTRPQSIFS